MRTSLSHPIQIAELPIQGGVLGLTFCPGKRGSSLNGQPWARDLETDMKAIKAWGASLIITLMERHEFQLLAVPDLPEQVAANGMAWLHLPIRDVDIPTAEFLVNWPVQCSGLLDRLAGGEKILLHCRGGLGRTGLAAAMLLIDTGVLPDPAITLVRKVRPGAIETRAQEAFVRAYHP